VEVPFQLARQRGQYEAQSQPHLVARFVNLEYMVD